MDENQKGLVKLDDHWVEDVSDLYLAAWLGQLDRVQELLKAGAWVNTTTSLGDTALHAVCRRDWEIDRRLQNEDTLKSKLVRLLLKSGANLHIRDKRGRTPLHYVAEFNTHPSIHIAELLLDHGVLVEILDNHHRSCLELAADCGNLGLVECLVRRHRWRADHVADAFELVALHYKSRSCYELLLRSLSIRSRYCRPKTVLPSLYCYRDETEWQTESEVSSMKDANDKLRRQCHISRERILHDRYISHGNMTVYISNLMDVSDTRVDALILHQIELFIRNGDHMNFYKVFIGNAQVPGILQKLLYRVDCGYTIPEELLVLAIECCQTMKAKAMVSACVSDFRNAIFELERTSLLSLGIVNKLNKGMKFDANPYISKLSDICSVDCETFTYKSSLLHMFLNPCSMFQQSADFSEDLFDMILEHSKDVSVLDADHNTALHLAVMQVPRDAVAHAKRVTIIKQLLEHSVHFDGINKQGQTALRLAQQDCSKFSFEGFLITNLPLPSLKCLAANVIKTRAISLTYRLPTALVGFVMLH